jgi:aldehyde dehydrogenase (NAD+)
MQRERKFYIDGEWVDPIGADVFDLVNPATEQKSFQISMGNAADVDRAVKAARAAFPAFSRTSGQSRVDLLHRITAAYEARSEELARAISNEMGAPIQFSRSVQVPAALSHFRHAAETLRHYDWESPLGTTKVVRDPIGVCGLITAWNWPLMLVTSKLAYALAAGCTIVLKPSEHAPISNLILAEILNDAGVPRGVFNLVNGDGPTVGHAICAHPDVDMISFTGSTRAGILIAKTAADSVKRVHQELGGKSANIILADANLAEAIPAGVMRSFTNSGQACVAPTRMLVHRSQLDEAISLARETANAIVTGDPEDSRTKLGPLVNRSQYDRVQGYIQSGLDEGAQLVAGGLGRPPELERGYFIRPTIFAGVTPDMTISREEIFGPVLSILSYETEDEAIKLANDTVYGLASYVHSGSLDHARTVASQLESGRVYINMAVSDTISPFGGYKQSGNGRECGVFGFEEYLEVKAILGFEAA